MPFFAGTKSTNQWHVLGRQGTRCTDGEINQSDRRVASYREEEATREQLSALQKKVYVLLQPSYADFAVFTSHGRKFMKAMKYRTFMLTMEGSYISKEVPGPSTHSQWLSSFRVWRTAMIMLEVLDRARKARSRENLEQLLSACWSTQIPGGNIWC